MLNENSIPRKVDIKEEININTEHSFLNLTENKINEVKKEIENKNITQENINEKLKQDYEKIFTDKDLIKYFENSTANILSILDKKVRETRVEKEEEIGEETIIINRSQFYREKRKKEDKINILKIYVDLKNLYKKKSFKTNFSETLSYFVNNINGREKIIIENYLRKFDILFEKLIANLYCKTDDDKYYTFSQVFFQNINPEYLHFLNTLNMVRKFIALITKEKNENIFSIINEKNILTKEILFNVISKMIDIKKNYDEKEAKTFIEKELEYFDILLDYINFEKNFVYATGNENNENKNIFEKYVYYYEGLTVLNNDNYSYINEFKWHKNYCDEQYEWNKYIKNEYEENGINILFYSLNNNEFYETIFMLLKEITNQEEKNKDSIRDYIKLINGIIKIILCDEENLFKKYLKKEKTEEKEIKGIFKPIIDNINNRVKNYVDEKNTDELEEEYLNSLIVLLESFAEYQNTYLLEYIFEAKENDGGSVFETLINAYKAIIIDLKDEKLYNDDKKNKLIILNSLSNCIIEYIEFSNINMIKNINLEKINEINKSIIIDKNEDFKIERIIKTKFNKIKAKNFNKNMTYDLFIIENHLKIIIHLIKNFQKENSNNLSNNNKVDLKTLFFETLKYMNRCFKGLLYLQKIALSYCNDSEIEINYDRKLNKDYNINDNRINDLKNDVINLLDKYKSNKLITYIPLDKGGENEIVKYEIKNELLVLIFLMYQIIFYLINTEQLYAEYYPFLLINNHDYYIRNVKSVIEYYFGNEMLPLIVLLSFLQKIHDIIEIKVESNILLELNRLNPEYLDISENSMNYFISMVDFSSRETKLMTIYNYIECIIYDINRKKWRKNETCLEKLIFTPQRTWSFMGKIALNTYKFWEVVNLIGFIVLNCCLIDFYRKPRNQEDLIYNEIDNDQNFLLTTIWPIVHIFVLLAFLIYWLLSRAKLEYFFSLTKYINEYFSESETLKMPYKVRLLNKEQEDFYINNFFPKKVEEEIKNAFENKNIFEIIGESISYFYINYIKIFVYTTKTVYPFILSIICLALSFWSQIFLVLPLFLLFNLSETLTTIFYLIFNEQSITLILILIFFIIVLYIFSWFGFFFLPKMFKYEAVDKNNEIINADFTEENICSSTIPCILYFLNFGFRDSFMDMNLISFKYETGYYLRQFFFNLFIYIFIHLIFDNIFLVTISNAFDDLKKNLYEIDEKKKNVCFICDKTKNNCIEKHEDFDEHLEAHDLWKYIRYICTIILKKRNQYTNEEYYVWKQIKKKEIKWFPKSEDGEEEEKKFENLEKLCLQILENQNNNK